jgi:hypothetical protein
MRVTLVLRGSGEGGQNVGASFGRCCSWQGGKSKGDSSVEFKVPLPGVTVKYLNIYIFPYLKSQA